MNKIFVAGHNGMVGSAIVRQLLKEGVPSDSIITKEKSELDLIDKASVEKLFLAYRPTQVYMAAAKVGGIFANDSYPAEFIYQNLMIQTNIIDCAFRTGVKRLLFLGSSCIYPKLADQPMTEECLLTGKLEPTNEPYAIAKIAGIKMCESYNRQYKVDFRSVMPTNLYGPGDNYHSENSHVIPGLIARFYKGKLVSAPSIQVWGSGLAKREFLYVDDLAEACVHVMNLDAQSYSNITSPRCSHINVGCGEDVTICSLASAIAEVVGFKGSIEFDTSKPDGAPKKLLDVKRIENSGWKAKTSLKQGLRLAMEDFLERQQ